MVPPEMRVPQVPPEMAEMVRQVTQELPAILHLVLKQVEMRVPPLVETQVQGPQVAWEVLDKQEETLAVAEMALPETPETLALRRALEV